MPYLTGAFFSLIFFLFPPVVLAGSLDDAGPPSSPDSAMYTLEDIYNRLNTGAAGSKRLGAFTEPSAGPSSGAHNLDDVMGKAPSKDDTNGAVAADVLSSKIFWGLTSGVWGVTTGTMTDNGVGNTITPGTSTQTLAAGYWSSANTVSGDSDLTANNIKKDVVIFGVTGSYGEAGAPAPVAKTGQKDSYRTYDDGDLEKGVAWPNPRFTDNSDGTVTDNLTGLIWLKNADCAGAAVNWNTAIDYCAALYDGCSNCFGTGGDCGLSDGSVAGDWRLPNIRELLSLIDWAYASPALSNTAGTGIWTSNNAFSNVQKTSKYWTSTTYAYSVTSAWRVDMGTGKNNAATKTIELLASYIWPVRGGQ